MTESESRMCGKAKAAFRGGLELKLKNRVRQRGCRTPKDRAGSAYPSALWPISTPALAAILCSCTVLPPRIPDRRSRMPMIRVENVSKKKRTEATKSHQAG